MGLRGGNPQGIWFDGDLSQKERRGKKCRSVDFREWECCPPHTTASGGGSAGPGVHQVCGGGVSVNRLGVDRVHTGCGKQLWRPWVHTLRCDADS